MKSRALLPCVSKAPAFHSVTVTVMVVSPVLELGTGNQQLTTNNLYLVPLSKNFCHPERSAQRRTCFSLSPSTWPIYGDLVI
jgi:hypothetical protein